MRQKPPDRGIEGSDKMRDLEQGMLDGITRALMADIPPRANHLLQWLKKSVSSYANNAKGLIEMHQKSYRNSHEGVRGVGEEYLAGQRRTHQEAIARVKEDWTKMAIEACVTEGVGQSAAEAYVTEVFSHIDTTLPEPGEKS